MFRTSQEITQEVPGVTAYISVNKALVTQSSAAIPIVPLYISILYHVMKEKGTHEGCIEQMHRLYAEKLPALKTDERGMLRLDDWEMEPDVQAAVLRAWNEITDENLGQLADVEAIGRISTRCSGFRMKGVDYAADVEVDVPVESI